MLPGGPGGWADAGTAIAPISNATTVNNTMMRFICVSPPLQVSAGLLSPAVVHNATTLASSDEFLANFLELARIGSQLFVFGSSTCDQTAASPLFATFATRLSAQPLRSKTMSEQTPSMGG